MVRRSGRCSKIFAEVVVPRFSKIFAAVVVVPRFSPQWLFQDFPKKSHHLPSLACQSDPHSTAIIVAGSAGKFFLEKNDAAENGCTFGPLLQSHAIIDL